MFRRRERASGTVPITMLSDCQREQVGDWWKLASDRIDAGPRETSPLSASLMLEMTLGYAVNSGSRVPPLAYAFATRVGYALRMYVDTLAPPQPLDVSSIDPTVITTLTSYPVDDEIGTIDIPDDAHDQMLLPIVTLVSDTANLPDRFTEVVSVEPPMWNGVVEVATYRLQTELTDSGVIRRPRDLTRDPIESFMRFGYVLRCLDEAFALDTPTP